MELVGGLDWILADYFKPYRVRINRNRFERPHILLVAVLPAVFSLMAAYYFSAFIAASASDLIGIYAIIATVLTAIMPTLDSLVGPIDRDKIGALMNGSETSDENIREAKGLVAKVEVFRQLYAAVAWSVILLGVALIPLLILLSPPFQADIKNPATAITSTVKFLRPIICVGIAYAGSTSFIALIQIVTGVHLLTRHGQMDIEESLQGLKQKYHL